jgi:hypothetical protein
MDFFHATIPIFFSSNFHNAVTQGLGVSLLNNEVASTKVPHLHYKPFDRAFEGQWTFHVRRMIKGQARKN